MKKIKKVIIMIIMYCVVLVGFTPTTHAEQLHQKLTISHTVVMMKVYDITPTKDNGDLIIFKDNNGELWGAYGDLKDEYKGQYALVVLQTAKGANLKDIKVIDFILKDDIKYLNMDRIKDILML